MSAERGALLITSPGPLHIIPEVPTVPSAIGALERKTKVEAHSHDLEAWALVTTEGGGGPRASFNACNACLQVLDTMLTNTAQQVRE